MNEKEDEEKETKEGKANSFEEVREESKEKGTGQDRTEKSRTGQDRIG